MVPRTFVLASRSPQRRGILEQLGVSFEVRPADVEERSVGRPEQVVVENALEKARAVASQVGPDALVLGVDTEVYLDDHLFGKAVDESQARLYLQTLAGRTHEVFSGVALVGSEERTAVTRTEVTFRNFGEELIDWYLATGEWRDRAGAYAIQGYGTALVERIDGDYFNVVGLPAATLLDLEPGLLGG